MQVKVYLANLKLNRIYHFEKQKIIANDYLTQTSKRGVLIIIENQVIILISQRQGDNVTDFRLCTSYNYLRK